MRKFLLITIIALLGTIGLAACNKSGQGEAQTEAKLTRPTTAMVDDAIKTCRAKNPDAPVPATPPPAATAAAATTAATAGGSAAPSLKSTGAVEQEDPCARATVSASVWQPYLQELVTQNLTGITNSPYVYFVPSGTYPESQGAIGRVQDSLTTTVYATVLPGNMIAVAGPNSATTAQVVETAFKGATPGSFKGVVVLFVGDKADEAAVKAALEPSGATFRFAQM